RHAANGNTAFIELVCDGERAFATEDHERVDADHAHVGNRFFVNCLDAAFPTFSGALDEETAITRPENRPASGQKSTYFGRRQETCFSCTQQALETVFDADYAHAVFARGSLDHSTNYRVETRRIAAPG